MLEKFFKKKLDSIEIIELLEAILLFSILYFWIAKHNWKHDSFLVLGLFIVSVTKKILKKEKFLFNKFFFGYGMLWIGWISITYYSYNPGNIEIPFQKFRWDSFINIIFKSIFLFIVLIQIKFSKKIYELIYPISLLIMLIPTYRGIRLFYKENYIKKLSEERWFLWRDPNYYSFVLGVFILIGMVAIFYRKRLYEKILGSFISCVSFAILILGPQSRNVIIALIINFIIIIYLFNKERGKKNLRANIIILTVIGVFFKYILPKTRLFGFGIKKISNEARMAVYKKGAELVKENYLDVNGLGFLYFVPKKLKMPTEELSALHNDVLEIVVTQGVIGLLFYLGFIIIILRELIIKYNTKAISKEYTVLGILLVIYFIFTGFFDTLIYNGRALELIFLFLGIALQKNKNTQDI